MWMLIRMWSRILLVFLRIEVFIRNAGTHIFEEMGFFICAVLRPIKHPACVSRKMEAFMPPPTSVGLKFSGKQSIG